MNRSVSRTQTFVLFESEAESDADRVSGEISTGAAAALLLIIKLSAEAGIAGFTPIIEAKLKDGTWYTLHTFTELTANGTYVLALSPFVAMDASGISQEATVVLPDTIRVTLDYTTGSAGVDSFTTYAEMVLVQV